MLEGEVRMKRAELLELLKKARKQLKKYHVPKNEQTITLSIDTLENVLSEQPEVIRRKDCKHFEPDGIYTMRYKHNGLSQNEDWYYADGERKKLEGEA